MLHYWVPIILCILDWQTGRASREALQLKIYCNPYFKKLPKYMW
jgi:hypothetical protein